MAKPELVIFDCDGVLIDSEVLSLQAAIEILAQEHGIVLTMQEAITRFVGRSHASGIADIKEKNGIDVSERYLTRSKQRREELFEQDLKPIASIETLLDSLPMPKCVASGSSPERLRHSLELVGLWDRFAPHVYSATQVKNGKPAPDLFLFAAEQMGVAPSACLVVEDSVAGVRAGVAAGMKVFGFTGGSHCDDKQIERLAREGADAIFDHMDRMTEAFRDL